LAGGSSFSAEAQELPLATTLSSVPLPVEQTEQPVRSQYPYMQSTAAPSQMPGSTDSIMNIHRYGDSSRPTKSSRGASHQSVHSNGSMTNNDATHDYRYGGYAPVSSSSTGVATAAYGTESSGHHATSQRDYYPPPSNWTTSSGEVRSTVAYASGDERPYQPGQTSVKPDAASGVPHSEYGGAGRGSFDGMSNYSWSGH
jgi:hypothetical protein